MSQGDALRCVPRTAAAAGAVFATYFVPPLLLVRVAHLLPTGTDSYFPLFALQALVFLLLAAILRAPLISLSRGAVTASGRRAVALLLLSGALFMLLVGVTAVSGAPASHGFTSAGSVAAIEGDLRNSGVAGALLRHGFLMPLLEEFLFRVLVLGFLLRSMRPWLALSISVALFAIGHSSWLVSGFMGVALGLLYLRYRSAWLCVLAHSGHNLMVLGVPLLVASLHERNIIGQFQQHLLALQVAWFLAVVACFCMFFHHVLVVAGRGRPSLFAAQSPDRFPSHAPPYRHRLE